MLLEAVADGEIAEGRRITIPAHGVAARPMAPGHGACLDRHLDTVARIEARAAHLCQLPVWAEVAAAPFAIGLKAAGGQDHRAGAQLHGATVEARDDAVDPVVVMDQRQRPRIVPYHDAVLGGTLVQCLDEAGSTAPGFHRQAAPELEASVDIEGLPAVDRLEPHTLGPHPDHGLEALRHQQFRKVGIGPILGDSAHIVEELLSV